MQHEQLVVSPLWRAPVGLTEEQYQQLRDAHSSCNASTLVAAVSELSAEARDNMRRIFAASLAAQKSGGRILLVEGYRANSIEQNDDGTVVQHHLAGNEMGAYFHKLLMHTSIVDEVPVQQEKISYCTEEEIAAVARTIGDDARCILISGNNEPSRPRAQTIANRYMPQRAQVHTPLGVIEELGIDLTPQQSQFVKATALTAAEQLKGMASEGKAWCVQRVSDAVGPVRGRTPVEWMAHILRKDKPS